MAKKPKEEKKKFKLPSLASFVSTFKKRSKKFLKEYKELWIASGIFIFLLAFVTVICFSLTVPRGIEEYTEPNPQQRHPLTGELIQEPFNVLPQVFGVMVENSKDAWPLSGLHDAFLVIEAPVEANIPRFIAFFAEGMDIGKIGPVRSARPYYLDWADALGAVYAHVGGSPESLELISNEYDTIDLNQFFESEYFYRQNSGGRYAPHNVYTTGNLLISALDELALGNSWYDLWNFKDDDPVDTEDAVSVEIDFESGFSYTVFWEYDSETNDYLRYQGGNVMLMEDGEEIRANNVIVIATQIRVIDNVGRKSLQTVGEGNALIIQDGEAYVGTWKKEQRTDRMRFYTYNGYEISLNAGTTWIEVVEDLNQTEVK